MARTVADVALFLSAIAGPDPRSPLSIDEDPAHASARRSSADFKGVRVAWWQGSRRHSVRAGDPRASSTRNRQVFEILGCIVEEAEPDFAGVDEAFPDAALRRAITRSYAPLVARATRSG